MKGTLMIMAMGTLLFGACSTSDTTSKMYGRDEYNGAEARVNAVPGDDVYRGNSGSSGVIEKRDISQDARNLNEDTYTGTGRSTNNGINPTMVPDVNRSTGTGSGTGVPTGSLNNSAGNGNGNGTTTW